MTIPDYYWRHEHATHVIELAHADVDELGFVTSVEAHPDHLGEGHGTAIMRLVVDDADKRGLPLHLYCEPHLIHWYATFGFALEATRHPGLNLMSRRVGGLGWLYDDGGRQLAGFKGETGDCGVRALAIGLDLSYRTAYDLLYVAQREYVAGRRGKRGKTNPSPRTGVFREVLGALVEGHGWRWTPLMRVGAGRRVVHLRADELPLGRLIASCSKHFVAVVDHCIRDTHDPSRDGTRLVYGYWSPDS